MWLWHKWTTTTKWNEIISIGHGARRRMDSNVVSEGLLSPLDVHRRVIVLFQVILRFRCSFHCPQRSTWSLLASLCGVLPFWVSHLSEDVNYLEELSWSWPHWRNGVIEKILFHHHHSHCIGPIMGPSKCPIFLGLWFLPASLLPPPLAFNWMEFLDKARRPPFSIAGD